LSIGRTFATHTIADVRIGKWDRSEAAPEERLFLSVFRGVLHEYEDKVSTEPVNFSLSDPDPSKPTRPTKPIVQPTCA
jgi:hypothetical protein